MEKGSQMIIDLEIMGLTNAKAGHLIAETIEESLNIMLPRRVKPLYIEVEIARDKDIYPAKGLVHQEDDDTFFMSLSQSVCEDYEELMYTVAHECVHMKQYLRKEVVDLNVNEKKWKGEFFDLRETPYSQLPWEKEAHVLEMIVANKVAKKWFSEEQAQ